MGTTAKRGGGMIDPPPIDQDDDYPADEPDDITRLARTWVKNLTVPQVLSRFAEMCDAAQKTFDGPTKMARLHRAALMASALRREGVFPSWPGELPLPPEPILD